MRKPKCTDVLLYTLPAGPKKGETRPLLVTSAKGDVVTGIVHLEEGDLPADGSTLLPASQLPIAGHVAPVSEPLPAFDNRLAGWDREQLSRCPLPVMCKNVAKGRPGELGMWDWATYGA
jgi:hypothetical protein